MKALLYVLAFWIPIAACIWCVLNYLMPVEGYQIRKDIWLPENSLVIDNQLPSVDGTYYLNINVYRRLDATDQTVYLSTENDTMRVVYRSEDKDNSRIKFSASQVLYERGLREVRDYQLDQGNGQLILFIDDNLELLISLLVIAPLTSFLIGGFFALIIYVITYQPK